MRFMQSLVLIILSVFFFVSSLSAQEAEESTEVQPSENSQLSSNSVRDFMDGILAAQTATEDIQGAVVAVVSGDEVIYSNGFGYQDRSGQIKMDASSTLVRPGSVSKLFTWTAVMQLVERGQLDLDTDVNEYLDAFQIPDTFPEPITLTHILTHTAGFEEGFLGYLIIEDEDRILPLEESMQRYMPARVNPPGKQSSYSNYATALAGLIVEKVSGVSFNEYIEENILAPLGMDDSSFVEPLPEELDQNMATGYSRENGLWKAEPFELIANFGPAGALSATATDMTKFIIAHLNYGAYGDARILQEDTARLMHSQLFTHDERLPGMAHGFYETDVNGFRLVGHGGDTIYFHSLLTVDHENDVGIFVSYSGSAGPRNELVNAFYDRFFPGVERDWPTEAPEDFSERVADYVGTYGFWRSNFSTTEKILQLAGGEVAVQPGEDNRLLMISPLGITQYIEVGEDLFQQVEGDQLLAFQRDEADNVTGFVFEGLVFLSAFKKPFYMTGSFNNNFLAVSAVLFVFVLISWAYRRKIYKAMPREERMPIRASQGMALANLVFLALFGGLMTVYSDSLANEVPTGIRLSLYLPFILIPINLWHVWMTVVVWRNKYWGIFRRLHHSLLSVLGLFLIWFYWYWNLLGPQFLS